jgi:aminomethyltransferase
MGIYKLDAYVLIIRGKDRFSFIDGLSTNRVNGDCSTVFTTTTAKVVDLADVIDMGEFLAIVGHGPYKNNLIEHISKRILGQQVSIGDASSNNSVYLSTSDVVVKDSVTKRSTWRGWLLVAPNTELIDSNMDEDDFSEYRIENMIPHQGYEITSSVHPLACGLGHLVHEAKGCYIGQEILARMRSRGRQGKKLVCLPNPVEGATTVGNTHSLAIVRVKSD